MTIRRDFPYSNHSSLLLFQPSPFVDQVWHAHILNTHDYKAFCKQVFGHFMYRVKRTSQTAALTFTTTS
jgi:hypothetical protein